MLTIEVTTETSASPDRVLEAGRDFTDWRAEAWPNVKADRLVVHDRGETFAEVTEGTFFFGLLWERCRYDWSEPGCVRATVIDSNVVEPGSTWELCATPREGRTDVTVTAHRTFRKSPKGRMASAINHTIGKPGMRSNLRHAVRAVERRAAA
jgi:hypothetical protein